MSHEDPTWYSAKSPNLRATPVWATVNIYDTRAAFKMETGMHKGLISWIYPRTYTGAMFFESTNFVGQELMWTLTSQSGNQILEPEGGPWKRTGISKGPLFKVHAMLVYSEPCHSLRRTLYSPYITPLMQSLDPGSCEALSLLLS